VPYGRNVFINRPFDDEYKCLLSPLLFSVYALGLELRIALEAFDSGKSRIDRHWLSGCTRVDAPSPSRTWADFIEFMSDNQAQLARRGYSRADIDALPIRELMRYMRNWFAARR
jgi:hypothetical protein